MTVIAYDGRRVSADRMATVGSRLFTTKKLVVVHDYVLAYDGDSGHGKVLIEWFKMGADPASYPPPRSPGGEFWATLHVFQWSKPIRVYECTPWPIVLLDTAYAAGSGGSIALGAMLAGASAHLAVEIACRAADGCGNGMDTVDLEELADEYRRKSSGSPPTPAVRPVAGDTGPVQLRPVPRQTTFV